MKVNVENLRSALKKLKGFTGNTIIMKFMTKVVKDGEADERYLGLAASNGTVQAEVMCTYTGENEETKKYIVSAGFADVVETVAVFGDTLYIEEDGGHLRLECGDAVVSVDLLNDATSLKMTGLKDAEKLHIKVNSKKFEELMLHGGFATGDASVPVSAFRGTVVFVPYEEKDSIYLRTISCCMAFFAGAITEVETEDAEAFSRHVNAGKKTVVSMAPVLALSRRLISESVDIFMTDKQMILRDGIDMYIFTVINGDIPKQIVSMICDKVKRKFVYSLNSDLVKKALTVAGLAGDTSVRLIFEDDNLVVSDTKQTSRVCVPVTAVEGEKVERVFNLAYLKLITSSMPAELTVYGPAGVDEKQAMGLYFEGKDCRTYVLPLKDEKFTKDA